MASRRQKYAADRHELDNPLQQGLGPPSVSEVLREMILYAAAGMKNCNGQLINILRKPHIAIKSVHMA